MSDPTVSVVMSVHNGEAYLAPAIESILAQTYRDFELVVIDDGSSDTTPEIIHQYTSDARVRVITQENAGLVAALNRGVSAARSELLARMDADDLSLPERLERQVAFLDAHPEVALVGSCYRTIDEKGRALTEFIAPSLNHDLCRKLYICNPFPHGGIMMRRVAFERAGRYRACYTTTEDYDLWRRMVGRAHIANLPQILYVYRINTQGIGLSNSVRQAAETECIQNEMWHDIPFPSWSPREVVATIRFYLRTETSLRRQLLQDYAQDHYRYARALLARGQYEKASGYVLGALLLDPLGALRKAARRPVRQARVDA